MLKRQHVFIRSLLALNTIDDSPTSLSKLQITPFEAFFPQDQQAFECTQNAAKFFLLKCQPKDCTSGRQRYALISCVTRLDVLTITSRLNQVLRIRERSLNLVNMIFKMQTQGSSNLGLQEAPENDCLVINGLWRHIRNRKEGHA